MNRIPVVIDTDPGIDDFFAMMLAASSPALQVEAVTAVAGNQTLDTTAKNALDIAARLGLGCPVARGADRPLNIPLRTAGYIHGENGLGNLRLPAHDKQYAPGYAWDMIYQKAVEHGGALQVIALGPLTNIAIALLKYPDLHERISRIVLMGGSTETGNKTPYGEFNLVVDPLAADIVFKSGVPLVMVGLNVTMAARFSREELRCITGSSAPIAAECAAALDFLFGAYEKVMGTQEVALHDALAAAYVINPAVLGCKDLYVAVETRSPLNAGRTVVDLEKKKDCPPNCSVALEVSAPLFLEMLGDMMRCCEEKEC